MSYAIYGVCDCGGEKHGWPHSSWCSTASANYERRRCEGFDSPCNVEGPGVQREPGRTMYVWDGKGENPNRGRWLCRDCAKYYHEYWNEMWSYVHGSYF